MYKKERGFAAYPLFLHHVFRKGDTFADVK
jgi:hypothetical protein